MQDPASSKQGEYYYNGWKAIQTSNNPYERKDNINRLFRTTRGSPDAG